MDAKILIVDDSETERMIIANILSDFNVLTASDGLEAMQLVEINPDIDLIVLDLNMPQIDGFQVLENLKSNDKYSKISTIILTNYDEIDNEIKGLKLGAVDYIRKPVNFESLRVRIDINLELIKAQRKTEQDKELLNSMVATKTAELIAMSEKLSERELLFRTIFSQAPIGIAIVHNDKFIISSGDEVPSINPMFEKITGRSKEELSNISWADITHPDDLAADLENFREFKAGEIDGYEMEKRFLRTDGSYVWVHMVITQLKLNNFSDDNHLCLLEDISNRKLLEKVLHESERSKSVLISNLPGMAYRCNYDPEWTMQFVSEGCLALTGFNSDSLLYNQDLSFNDLIAPEYRETLWLEWQRTLAQKLPFRHEYEIIAANGKRKWVLEMGQGVYDETGIVEALEGIVIDITDRKEKELHILYLNEHDYLTQLYNRRYFEEILTCDANTEHKCKRAVLLVNLQNFNRMNLTHGYHFGEKLIREIAELLYLLCKNNCQLFQISMDRFCFYIKGYENSQELADFCDVIIETLNNSLPLKTIGSNIGVLEIDQGNYDAGSIIKNASIAAKNVSEIGTFGYRFFDSEMEAKIIRQADINNELTYAAYDESNHNLYLQYQPILDLKTNQIHGFEALARLKSEKLGIVSPLEFIPIAEETQLIIPLGKKIMRLAFSFLKQLEANDYNNINIAFNVSAIQLLSDNFLPDLTEVLNEIKINPFSLNIEITESIFSNNFHEINEKLEKIKSLGISISIDDFGTGYSSLARGRELNITCTKIDKYFIDKLLEISPDRAITGDIISMAHKLGHCVVAEGVEHEKQKQYLIDNDCDLMQGYLFSKPIDQESALRLLESYK